MVKQRGVNQDQMIDDKALITEIVNKPLTKSDRVEKVKPVLVFAKKEKKKYSFNKNTYNHYYSQTVNNNNSFEKPEINEGDGFIVSVLKLFSSFFFLLLFLIKHFFTSLLTGNFDGLSKKSREYKNKKKLYKKLREV